MRVILFLLFFLVSCRHRNDYATEKGYHFANNQPVKDYESVLQEIAIKRKEFSKQSSSGQTETIPVAWKNFWIKKISIDLYNAWEGTPWDFNGHTRYPQQGSIACGYFVTTMLCDMGMHIDRVKLSTCASMQMMKTVCPDQKIQNLGRMGAEEMNNYLNTKGKAVYIAGLDFHTGIIVSDGTGNWFIHSDYIRRRGVVKERIQESLALRASKTIWIVPLTESKVAMRNWLR